MIFCFMGLAVKFKFAYSLYLFHIMKLRFVLWYLYLELYSSRLDCQEKTEKKFRFKNVNIKFDIFSCFYRFAVLHNT